MVRLLWEDKSDISENIEALKNKFKIRFNKLNLKNGLIENSNLNSLNSHNWVNKLFWGDNFEVMCYLLNFLEEKVDLVYIDPPFFQEPIIE